MDHAPLACELTETEMIPRTAALAQAAHLCRVCCASRPRHTCQAPPPLPPLTGGTLGLASPGLAIQPATLPAGVNALLVRGADKPAVEVTAALAGALVLGKNFRLEAKVRHCYCSAGNFLGEQRESCWARGGDSATPDNPPTSPLTVGVPPPTHPPTRPPARQPVCVPGGSVAPRDSLTFSILDQIVHLPSSLPAGLTADGALQLAARQLGKLMELRVADAYDDTDLSAAVVGVTVRLAPLRTTTIPDVDSRSFH